MVQARRELRLTHQPGPERRVRGELGGQHLQRDVPVQSFVAGPVDLAGSAPAGELDHPVAGEQGADQHRFVEGHVSPPPPDAPPSRISAPRTMHACRVGGKILLVDAAVPVSGPAMLPSGAGDVLEIGWQDRRPGSAVAERVRRTGTDGCRVVP